MTDLGLHSALFISTPINTWQSLSALCHHHGNVYKREKCNAENTLKLQKKTRHKTTKSDENIRYIQNQQRNMSKDNNYLSMKTHLFKIHITVICKRKSFKAVIPKISNSQCSPFSYSYSSGCQPLGG